MVDEGEDVYVDWAIEDLNRLRGAYLDLVDAKGKNASYLKEIGKVSGDIEGQGGNYDFPLMTKIGHSLGVFVKDKTELDDLSMEVVRLHVEALQTVIKHAIVGEGGPVGIELVKGLDKVIKKVSG